MFSQVLLNSLPQSVLAPWRAVLTAGFPKVWANIPRLLVNPFVLESRSFAPFRVSEAVFTRLGVLATRLGCVGWNAVAAEATSVAPVGLPDFRQGIVSLASPVAGRRAIGLKEIHPGDVISFAPSKKHWHGSTPTTAMTHIAIQRVFEKSHAEAIRLIIRRIAARSIIVSEVCT
jgi:hypothetical protein